MGRQQFYKGNPELKQYFLVNDFSGGINTTDVDERTADNEFRDLLNVELIRTGMLQNRKGWGEVNLLNALLASKNIVMPRFNPATPTGEAADRYALIKIVKNEGNLLTVLDNYERQGFSFSSFLQLNLVYRLEMLLIYETTVGIKVSLLTLSNTTALDGIVDIYTFTGIQFGTGINNKKLLSNIETVEYTDFLYFPLSQIQENIKGLFEYNVSTKTYRIVRDDELPDTFIYKPTPYEVSKIGFNVLSNTPLTDISEQVGFLSITGLFLTAYEVSLVSGTPQLVDTQKPITNFSQDGKVTVNILYTGENVELKDFTVEFYVMGESLTTGLPEERPINFTVDASKLEGTSGIARFACNVEVKNNPSVYIRIKLLSGIVFTQRVVTRSFSSVSNMVANFNPAVNAKFAVADGASRFVLYNKLATPYQYQLQTGFAYNPGSGVQTFTPIYNDTRILAVKAWTIPENGEALYNAASSREDKNTETFAQFDNMTDSNVLVDVNNYQVGFVLKVRKTKYELATKTGFWTEVPDSTFVDITRPRGGDINSGLSDVYPQDPPSLDNFTASNLEALAPAKNYENNQIVRVYSMGWVVSPIQILYRYKSFKANVTTVGTNQYVPDSPEQYKYFLVSAPSAELANPIVTYNAGDGKLYYRSGETKTPILENVARLNNISERIPKVNELYLADITAPLVEANYYRYNGFTTGTADDFIQATFVTSADTSIYTDIYNVGNNLNAEVVKSLDLTGYRILEIGNRLVLYKNNIIWFSDLYQFDYIPNYNYIILPLTADDFITGVHYFKGSYMIFTKERIYKMSGTFGTGDFQVQIVNDAIGAISPYSIKAFNNTIVFMTHDGLYRIKQNYYSGGLENVEKIDKQLDGIIPNNVEVYAFLYNEQYILVYDYKENRGVADPGFNVLKMYYNMTAPNGFPYVKDRYSIMPNIITKFDDGMYSIKYGRFYKYDNGYYDFLKPGIITEEQRKESLFTTKIRTHKLSFGYPTHEKKFKAIIVKDIANEPVPLLFDIYVNNKREYKSADFQTVINDLGQIDYVLVAEPYTIGSPNLLGDFELNKDQLGDLSARVHKIVFSGRGKDVLINIERTTAQQFSIQDIGYVYKVGKAREDR
jgi:hypothetical protein